MLWVGGAMIYYPATESFGKGTLETIISLGCFALGGAIVWANLKAIFKD